MDIALFNKHRFRIIVKDISLSPNDISQYESSESVSYN